MGAAWRARDERMRRDVVLTQLSPPPGVDAVSADSAVSAVAFARDDTLLAAVDGTIALYTR